MSDDELIAMVSTDPQPLTVWLHRKGGKYMVVGIAIEEATLRPIVCYTGGIGVMWLRPRDEFMDGRFTPIDEACIDTSKTTKEICSEDKV